MKKDFRCRFTGDRGFVDNMKYLQDIEDIKNLKEIVLQDLKGLGVKAPKPKKCKNKEEQQVGLPLPGNCTTTVFGNYLCSVPSLLVDGYGPVPRFLVEATAVLDEHIHTEGLFRKSGSVARQKELREKIEAGSMLTDANPLDLASLIKQFFRELADPLLTFKLHDTFLKAYMNLEEDHGRCHATLLLCLLLPWPHLSTLRFFMIFLGRVASHCDVNKMDVANLAVCLAPNILHNNQKMEKMSGSESKLLKIQTNIVEFLISNANSIGMVSESLAGRTVMLSTCFPSEDELEKSDDGLNESKPKKKKKRSGSLQGLVNNLSNSFSKWRRDSKGHNSSNMSNQSNMSDKSSMYSIMSDPTDFSVMSQDVTGYTKNGSFDAQGIMLSEVTPKVMRKRKMSGEMIPFSANKKKAILQQMPHMSTLGGTPFTPLARTRSQGHDFHLDTPNIKFTEDSSRLLFRASTHTPTNNQLLPSTTKIKRHNSSKSSCFNQKTPKSKRRSVRGFLRKLSGGKELQPVNGVSGSSDAAARLADISGPPDHVTIIRPDSGKKKGFFSSRKHRKTPSLPARLVMKEGRAVAVHDDLDNSCDTTANGSNNESGFEVDSSPMLRQRRRGFSADGTPTSAAIRRGRPNTVSVGLPAEKMSGGNRSRRSMDLPPRHSSQRDIFASPERKVAMGCDAAVIDTSPIKADPLDDDDIPRVSFDDFEEDESVLEKCIDDEDGEGPLDQSTTSTCMETVPHDQAMHEHDQAFIHEMTVCTDQMEKPAEPPDGFKKPHSIPPKKAEKVTDATCDSERMDASVSSDASNTSVITVLYNGQPVPSKPPISSASLPRPKSCHLPMIHKPDKQLRTQLSAGSIDSGLGHESLESLNSLTGKITKSVSKNSLTSTDSAIEKDEAEEKKAAFMSQFADRKITHENSDSALLQKNKSQTVKRRSHEPNLHMSDDVQHMLSRAGVIPQESEKPQMLVKQSVVDLRENNVGKVAESVKQFDHTKEDQAVVERKTEPLRFHNSVTRRGTSPLRIPTIFVKADEEVMKYKEMATRGRSPAPKSSARPALPISTNLLRTSSVKSAKLKLASNDSKRDEKPLQVTPESGSSGTSILPPVDMSESLIETINDVCTPKSEKISKQILKDSSNLDDMLAMTPKIKPCMLSTSLTAKILTKGLSTPRGSLEGKTVVMRKCRSPVKPVKRLQGSPSSPRSPHKSPTKVTNKHSISPLPSHVSDWNF